MLFAEKAGGMLQLKQRFRFSSDPNIIVAQYGALKRQVPLLYFLLVVNASAVAYTHRAFAPAYLTLGFMVVMFAICMWRAMAWIYAKDAHEIGVREIHRQLVRTTVLAGVLGVVFLVWSLTLEQYGGPNERGHVALFIAATVIGCIFCLVHLPQAAMAVVLVVTVPYLIYYVLRGDPVYTAIAFNIALVTGTMIQVLLNSFATFTDMIRSKSELITKQSEAERLGAENARLAQTDVLTGLPNRRYFFSQFEEALETAKAAHRQIAVGVFDLDRFKPINDTYGHVMGDRLLCEVGRRLASTVNRGTIVARLGGDEFGLLFTTDIDTAHARGQFLCDLLSEPFVIEGQTVMLGCSAGMAIYPEAGETVHELFDRSDYALYHVKTDSRGGCTLFSLEHETRIRSERAVETALQRADLERELHVRYQPIVCTQTGKVFALEALGRWTSPTIGSVPPDRFITIAERLGLIHAITLTLFRKALTEFATLPDTLGLSFNLSAHDIASPETLDRLIEVIEQSRVDPKRLTFELTETALMRDFDAAVRGICMLRALGTRLALDDFGTGYSSLGYLRRLPLDKVKVDRSFIKDMDELSGRNILFGILGLCQTLELDCIIEGVESEAQLRSLVAMGYRQAQGYFFSEPLPIHEIEAAFEASPQPSFAALAHISRMRAA